MKNSRFWQRIALGCSLAHKISGPPSLLAFVFAQLSWAKVKKVLSGQGSQCPDGPRFLANHSRVGVRFPSLTRSRPRKTTNERTPRLVANEERGCEVAVTSARKVSRITYIVIHPCHIAPEFFHYDCIATRFLPYIDCPRVPAPSCATGTIHGATVIKGKPTF